MAKIKKNKGQLYEDYINIIDQLGISCIRGMFIRIQELRACLVTDLLLSINRSHDNDRKALPPPSPTDMEMSDVL